jgi:maleate isomerase
MNTMHRIGLLVPSSNTTLEAEVSALLRARERVRPVDAFTFHSARLRMADVTAEALRAMNEQTERATLELADMRPDVVATACLVAIMAQGPNSHGAVQAEIASILEREHAPAPVVSSAGALVDALHALGARRIGIVAPYLEELTRVVVDYIEHAGIEVGDAVTLEVSDNRAVAALDSRTSSSTGAASTCAAVTPSCFRPACRCDRCR